ncbi:MAG: XRE family transcriptional regulator [Candidatus Aminicenantes bacterium]|nr:XRE family transcriptional regulator [Candidatus Aminicenantes bacterium]
MKIKVMALVKPELLVWARESAGLSIELVSKKNHTNPDKIAEWESGKTPLTITQLRNLAEIYKRPLAVFYLSTPPKKFKVPHDYRKLYGDKNKSLSPQLLYEIRRAQERRSNAIELYELIGEKIPPFDLSASLDEDPAQLSKVLRSKLGIEIGEQFDWISTYQAYNKWRRAIENLGVLVFQAQRIPKNEMRAFSISEKQLPLIVLNSSDDVTPRIFSIIHELVHLVLSDEGLCDIDDTNLTTEIFCNRVAGEVLVPTETLRLEKIFNDVSEGKSLHDQEILRLSNKYKVSREVILRRFLINGAITEKLYKEKRVEYLESFQKRMKIKGKKPGYAPPSVTVVANSGRSYTGLVLRTYYQEKITACTVSNYLDVKLKHLPNIEAAINMDFF